MARKPMVTRTITTTKVNVLCLNVVTGEPFNMAVTLPRTYKDEKSLMKQVSAVVDNEEVKAVHVVDKNEVETLYGMTEQEFISRASILDKDSRKVIEHYSDTDSAQTEETVAPESEETVTPESEDVQESKKFGRKKQKH